MEGHEQRGGSAAEAEQERADIYDEGGVVRASFLAHVGAAIADRDTLALKRDVGGLHETELGHLLEALLPEQRRALAGRRRRGLRTGLAGGDRNAKGCEKSKANNRRSHGRAAFRVLFVRE